MFYGNVSFTAFLKYSKDENTGGIEEAIGRSYVLRWLKAISREHRKLVKSVSIYCGDAGTTEQWRAATLRVFRRSGIALGKGALKFDGRTK